MESPVNSAAPVTKAPRLSDKQLYMDVTHTLTSTRDSGVQRVVRKLAQHAMRWPNLEFVRYEDEIGRFVVLTSDERQRLLLTQTGPYASPDEKRIHKSRLSRIIRRILRPLVRLWKSRYTEPRPDLSKGVYMTAEVVADAPRVRLLSRMLFRHHGLRLFVVHDLIPLSHPEMALISPRDFSAYCNLLLGATGLIADSCQTLNSLRALFLSRSAPWPLLAETLFPATDLGLHSASMPGQVPIGPRILACIGTIETRKNQLPLLGILKTLWDEGKEFGFVFAGRPGNCAQAFSEAVTNLQQGGYKVVWLKEATDEEINWLYRNATATVYPSTIEGFGLPVLESLKSGTPCITSSGTSTGEIASHFGGCITVDPHDTPALTTAVRDILGNPELVTALKESIRHDQFRGWDHYATEVLGMVENLLNG